MIIETSGSGKANVLLDLIYNQQDIDSNWTRTLNHLVHERTMNHLARLVSLAKWLSLCLQTKWL